MRYLWVSHDGTELRWGKSVWHKHLGLFSKLYCASLEKLVLGSRTDEFLRYDWTAPCPQNCLTIVSSERNLHLEFDNRDDYMLWTVGLQTLMPLSHTHFSRAAINWHRLFCLCRKKAMACRVSVEDFVKQLPVWKPPTEEQRKALALARKLGTPDRRVVTAKAHKRTTSF